MLNSIRESLEKDGYAILPTVLKPDFLARTKKVMRAVQVQIEAEVGSDRLQRAGERGVLRLMMKFSPQFFTLLEIPEVLEVIDEMLSPTAILHLQNGFILPSLPAEERENVAQFQFHRDFPRYMNGYRASLNFLFAIDEFTENNGATLVVPGSHRKAKPPPDAYMQKNAVKAFCPAGGVIVFDSMLWHAAGNNTSGQDRFAINHQFTRSFFKQQFDYVRALGENTVIGLPPRSQQFLGYYTRVVSSLDQYYQPEEKRLYRRHQG